MKQFMLLFSAITMTLAVLSCKKKKDDNTPEFDKGSLLTNVADNIIIPSITDFNSDLIQLQADYSAFQTNQDQTHLDALRTSWINAYTSWQTVQLFDFGPMTDNNLSIQIGTFPSDTAIILNNITSGSYDLSSSGNESACGLSALDFLLYRSTAMSDVQTNPAYLTYIGDVVQKLTSESALLISAWNSYRSTFIASTGTESTSAFSLLVNEFNRHMELTKNAKLGIPLGKQSLGIQLPEYIETRYSGISLDILKESIARMHQLYNGDAYSNGATGTGFDDYLVYLEKTSLSNTINSKYSEIVTKIDSFSNTLEEEMATNTSELDVLYNLIAGQIINIKTDMTSAFGVLITYQDNDGD